MKHKVYLIPKRVFFNKEMLGVGSKDNFSIEILGGILSFFEETSSTLHSFRLIHEENNTKFIHLTASLPNGSYPITYTEFKDGVWCTEVEIDDRNVVYRYKNFFLFFVEKNGFLKLPPGKYTPKFTEQGTFPQIKLEFLDIAKNAFFNRTDGFCAIGIELTD